MGYTQDYAHTASELKPMTSFGPLFGPRFSASTAFAILKVSHVGNRRAPNPRFA
jgi:hypothetical protein